MYNMSATAFYLAPVRTTIDALTTVLFKTAQAGNAPLSTTASNANTTNHANYTQLATCAIVFKDFGAFYKMKIKGMDFDGYNMHDNLGSDAATDVSFLAGGSSETKIGVTSGQTTDLDLGSYRDATAGTLASNSAYAYTAVGATAANTYAVASQEYMTDLYMGKVSEDIFTDSQYIKLFDNESAVRTKVKSAVTATSAAFNNLSASDDTYVNAVDLSTSASSASPAQVMFNLFQGHDDLSARLKTRLDDIAAAVTTGKGSSVSAGDEIGSGLGEYAAAADANAVRDVIVYLPVLAGDTIVLNSYFNVDDSNSNGTQVIASTNLGTGDGGSGAARHHHNYYITCTATATA
jgi:hypothetical protein